MLYVFAKKRIFNFYPLNLLMPLKRDFKLFHKCISTGKPFLIYIFINLVVPVVSFSQLVWTSLWSRPFGQRNMHCTLNFFPDQSWKNQMCQSLWISKVLLWPFSNIWLVINVDNWCENCIYIIIQVIMAKFFGDIVSQSFSDIFAETV